MAMLLAPYNDSMRLGMGFNSYTQTLCIDNAVKVESKHIIEKRNPSQVVTYTSKFVERLSDIVSTMNISYSSAIKKGTIEVAGNGNSIDEDKIKASDVNLVVSVQVINQTTILEDSAEFQKLDNVLPGSQAFNDAFGDCYISGFINGGDFSSIISMRSIDRSKTSSVVKSIKKMSKVKEAQTFTMDNYSFNDSLSNSEALHDTETTISVNWMGGGDIKDPHTQWDIDSVYAAAAAFPQNVAKTPQRTWAILTKYKANRSFNKTMVELSLKSLDYDAVQSYTAELFNNFMEYKQLVKRVQDIIARRDHYEKSSKTNAIPTTISTLVAVRVALRNEMNKIVAVVNVLSRRPELLQQANSFGVISKDEIVRNIMQDALKGSAEPKVILDPRTAETATATSNESEDSFDSISHGEAKTTPTEDAATSAKSTASVKEEAQVPIDLSQLIAPEVWADLLPTRIIRTAVEANANGAFITAAASPFPPPPKDDSTVSLAVNRSNQLHIHRAVCGLHDVTTTIQDRVVDGTSFSIYVYDIWGLPKHPMYLEMPGPFVMNLTICYQYGDGPIRLFNANYVNGVHDLLHIHPDSDHAEMTPRPWSEECLSILGCVYGGDHFTTGKRGKMTQIGRESQNFKLVEDAIRQNYKDSGHRCITFNGDLFGDGDDTPAYPGKTGVIFYRAEPDGKGPIRAAVGIEDKEPAYLGVQTQLASFNVRVIKEVKVREVKVQEPVMHAKVTATRVEDPEA